MKKLSIALLVFFYSANLYAEKYVVEIKPLLSEKWYGAYTAKAFCNTPLKDLTFQPYEANEKKKDLNTDNRGNQAAPLLISNKGRYVWSDEPFEFEFNNGSLIISSDHEKIGVVVGGKTLRDAYVAAKDKHFPASGKTPNPLMFKQPQYNMWIELNYYQTQEKVLRYADDVLKNGFPAGVFMIDDNWSKAYGTFEFDASKFPDPKKMVDELHAKGFKVMLWLTPFISADTKSFKDLSKEGALLLQKGTKKPALIKWWDGYSACLDFTRPKAVDWLRSQLKNLQKQYGIDGFKFDAADFDFYTKGSRIFPNEDVNTPANVQTEAFGKLGAEFDFNEFRAGWKNGNLPLAQRLQDKQYSWDDLKLLVPDMVSAGLIGHPFSCPDMIGGGLLSTFENIDYNKFDQELMIRSAQTQALMPMMQFSVAPWRVLDKKHLDIIRETALLHSKMGDYIYSLAQKAARDGEPIVRHMEYAFPNEGFESSNDLYMLGDKYLVAPMVDKGNTRMVKLPKGNWVDDTGKKYNGGQTVKMDVPLNRLVYFVRQS
ncbi:MAG TPA: glycoside hydrolase family 31 protein [Chitinophagaceae bacterium]|jgi:alpha-glucosidase|nr:glycoside hydrolase family 31 protein [Chitinophagaceae bacterium]